MRERYPEKKGYIRLRDDRTMDEAQIMDMLTKIQEELSYIRMHMIDADLLFTDDDLESLEEAEDELSRGKTVRLV